MFSRFFIERPIFATVVSLLIVIAGAVSAFVLPVGQLVFFLILAALAGVVVALLPARRAAKLNVLEAISYE